jgi:hypothetical protein
MLSFFVHVLNIVWGTLEDSAPLDPSSPPQRFSSSNARAALAEVSRRL